MTAYRYLRNFKNLIYSAANSLYSCQIKQNNLRGSLQHQTVYKRARLEPVRVKPISPVHTGLCMVRNDS